MPRCLYEETLASKRRNLKRRTDCFKLFTLLASGLSHSKTQTLIN